jgi:hypothetical protein
MLSIGLLMSPFGLAAAQRADSTGARADSLRQQIEERFASKAQEKLGLTNEQTARLRSTSQQFGTRRRELRARGHQLREALAGQLKPGVAANQDSVAKLTDAMIELRMAEAQLARDEVKDQSKYLNPVQRAQLYVMRERFAHRVREVHGHRGELRGRHRGGSWGDMERHRPGERQRAPRGPRTPPESSGGI